MSVGAEREVKLGAGPEFRLPDLDGVMDGVTPAPPTQTTLTSSYYDTADLRLARWGASLRHRSGDGSGWTAKLPDGDGAAVLARREVSFDGAGFAVPDAAADVVRAYTRRAPLQPVAQVRTHRQSVVLRGPGGEAMAEVVDDDVAVIRDGEVSDTFREVEVELEDEAGPELLDAVVSRLRHAGADHHHTTPKLVLALGAPAAQPPDLVPVEVGGGSSAGEALRAAVGASVTRVLAHDPGVRIGEDPADVHQMRVSTRRLRSHLRTFRPCLGEEWAEGIRRELRWVAGLLGAVRDADVLERRLRAQAGALPDEDASCLDPLLDKLSREREAARAELRQAMSSERYVDLLERLVAAANEAVLGPDADAPARTVVPELVRRQWRRLRKAVDALPSDPAPEELHRVRIRAKDARYAAEAAEPVVGKSAARLATRLADVQSVLGELQDAVVAERWLRHAVLDEGRLQRVLSGDAPVQALVAGELVAAQRAEAKAQLRRWPRAWKRVNRKKLLKWMS